MDGDYGYDYYEKYYKGQKWWEEMKQRRKTKTIKQKELDRKLVQQIGYWRNKPIINLSEIKKLVKQGAQIDHWVEFGGWKYNAVQLAAENGSDEATKAGMFLIEHFDFIQTERGYCYSPLGISINWGHLKMAKEIIKMKKSTNPIYSFLRCADYKTDDEKMKILEEIEKSFNFSKFLKEDLKQIKEEGKFGDDHVRSNLRHLFKFCKSKNMNLEECFGKSYEIKDPITWRFTVGNKHHWVAEEILKTFENGTVSIENLKNKIKVHFLNAHKI